MSTRFFVEQPIAGPEAVLTGDEARHLAQVLRARVGDEVTLFDGGGDEFLARVATVERREVRLAIVARRAVCRELPRRLILGVALPKGERQRWLVEKCVELGAAALMPLETARGVAQPTAAALDRLRRGVIEASKQSGRNRLMEVAPPRSCEQWFAEGVSPEVARLAAHPYDAEPWPVARERLYAAREVWIAVGPEGGFTHEEIAQARAGGWRVVSLGPRVLRVETAAAALLALAGCD